MKSYFKILAIAVVVFALLAPISCDNSGDEEIPYNVVKATEQMFEFVGMIIGADGNYTEDFSSDDFEIIEDPVGGWDTFPYTVELTAKRDISPSDGELIIKAFYFKLYLNDDPWTMTIEWTATLENWLYNTVSLNANFVWLGSNSPEAGGTPDTYTGTITVDGKAYSIADVINAAGWDELIPDDNEEESN